VKGFTVELMKSTNMRKWLFRLLVIPILFIAISLFTLGSLCVPPFESLKSTLPLTTFVTQTSEYSFDAFTAASHHYLNNHIPLLMRRGNGAWTQGRYRCNIIDCELIRGLIEIGIEPPIQCFRNEWNSHTVTFDFHPEQDLVEITTVSSRIRTIFPRDSISIDEIMQVAFKTIDQEFFNDYPTINITVYPLWEGDTWSVEVLDLNNNVLLERRVDYQGNLVQ
jgi:hypothetical protein